jgi:hypothetical protein
VGYRRACPKTAVADAGHLRLGNFQTPLLGRIRAALTPVLGRKNYLFCGSDAGGQRAACFYTIIETAKLNGIDPEAYLTDVISRIDNHPALEIDKLLPWCWQA